MPGSECSMAGFQCLTDIPDNSGSPDLADFPTSQPLRFPNPPGDHNFHGVSNLADFPNVRLSAAVSMTLVREDMSLKETFTKPEKPCTSPRSTQNKLTHVRHSARTHNGIAIGDIWTGLP